MERSQATEPGGPTRVEQRVAAAAQLQDARAPAHDPPHDVAVAPLAGLVRLAAVGGRQRAVMRTHARVVGEEILAFHHGVVSARRRPAGSRRTT